MGELVVYNGVNEIRDHDNDEDEARILLTPEAAIDRLMRLCRFWVMNLRLYERPIDDLIQYYGIDVDEDEDTRARMEPRSLTDSERDRILTVENVECAHFRNLHTVFSLFIFFKRQRMLDTVYEPAFETFLCIFNRIFGVLHFLRITLRSMVKAQEMTNPEVDVTLKSEDNMVNRFRPINFAKNTSYQNMIIDVLNELHHLGYRKYNEHCYAPKYVYIDADVDEDDDDRPRRVFSYYWEQVMSIEEFVYRFSNIDNFENWHNATSGKSNIRDVIEYLKVTRDPQFETLNKTRNVFSFKNGVYVVYDAERGADHFYPFGTQPMPPTDVVACRYIDMDFIDYQRDADTMAATEEAFERDVEARARSFRAEHRDWAWDQCLDRARAELETVRAELYDPEVWWWYDAIETPLFQGILDYQFRDHPQYRLICRWVYVLFIGRLLYDAGHLDKWQIMPFIHGIAGTGKSTITEIIRAFYAPDDVGDIENETEGKFCLSGVFDKFVVIMSEIRDTFNLDQAIFQKIISGEVVAMAEKYRKRPHVKRWTPAMIMLSNMVPGYNDTQGALIRRFAMIKFRKAINERDANSNLKDEIIATELAAIIKKANVAYQQVALRHARDGIWSLLPAYFVETKNFLASETNPLKHFMSSGKLVFGPQHRIPVALFRQAFKAHCTDLNIRDKNMKWGQTLYQEPFEIFGNRHNVKIVEKRQPAGDYHGEPQRPGNWILGLDLLDAVGGETTADA